MKKIFLLAGLLIASLTVKAQSALYQEMSQVSGVESFYYSKDLMGSVNLKDIENPDVNLTNLNVYHIQNLEYLSATKRRAIRKLRKAQEESMKKNGNSNASEQKIIMQINKDDRKLAIYKKDNNSYMLINDNKDRYTVIRMVADIPSFYLDKILVK